MARRSNRKAPTPKWAKDLVERIARDEGLPTAPRLDWRKNMLLTRRWETSPDNRDFWMSRVAHRAPWSRGFTYTGPDNLIVVMAGKDRVEARTILLHEMAHWLTQENHTARMYATLFDLVSRYGKPGDMKVTRARERGYKPRASKSGYRLYLRERRRRATA